MSTNCEQVTEDLAAIVDGDRDVIARHSEHLASCDDCRDARHEATRIATLVASAGADHVPVDPNALVERLLTTVGADAVTAAAPTQVMTPAQPAAAAAAAPTQVLPEPAQPTPAVEKRGDVTPITSRRKRPWLVAGAAAAAIAATGTVYLATHRDAGNSQQPGKTLPGGAIGKLASVSRAAADHADGVSVKTAGNWHPIRGQDSIEAGAEIKTDERTRTAIDLADGTHVVLDHLTTIAFDPAEPRRIRLTAGRIVADVAHVDNRPASIATPSGTIDVVGTRFEVTATDSLTSVEVVRGSIVLRDSHGGHEEVRAGEEGMIDHGTLSVSAAPALSKQVAWSDLETSKPAQPDETTAGLGALRAYKPGEQRDRDWKLALAKHDVKVRIVGPIARTEITETFRNDSATQLEGVYQFPLPADAQIDGLSLDVNGGFVDGAFVDKERAAKIWRGVIQRAQPMIQHPVQEIVWVPGPWKDPALLDWKRGGRFELRIFPIPANGARTIKLAYTQVVTPRGPWRQYIYPLPHSADGSTVADQMTVDVEVRGAAPNMVRTAGYQLVADPARKDVNAMTLSQGGFVPRGDLVVDYRAIDSDAELRAWTFTGGAAVAPYYKLAAKKNVGIDPKIIEAQRLVAGDARPTAVLALQPKLPRWRESKPRDYVIVVDDSQSMVGERFTRASDLAVAMVAQMDRRDRFTVMMCDSECRKYGAVRAPSVGAASELKSWLGTQPVAGASDVVSAIRAASAELTDGARDKWVLYVGDGFATTGFRRVADVERAIADSTGGKDIHVTTIGIGGDADEHVLTAAARGGGGSYLAWLPGQTVSATAVAGLESTYGAALRDAKIELPTGLADVAPTVLPTVRAGQEVLIAARITGDVAGDVVVKGTVGGQPFEQRYPLKLAVSAAAGNGFVPRLWASLAIDQLEHAGRGEDRPRMVALSQGYGVMSRQTSLLVLESQAMFDAFGVDRTTPTAKWTGEDSLDEVDAAGQLAIAQAGKADMDAKDAMAKAEQALNEARAHAEKADKKQSIPTSLSRGGFGGGSMPTKPSPAPATARWGGDTAGGFGMSDDMFVPPAPNMVAMRKVYTRVAAISAYDGVNSSITKSISDATDALAKSPDSREKHRALVQALSYAGELDKARDIANRWLDRDKLDPQALGYLADLAGRNGERDQALRTLAGLVDLDADKVALHERMAKAYERTGRLAQSCGHRIALASLQAKDVTAAGVAARCLRTIGRPTDADIVMHALPDDSSRANAEKAATVAAVAPRVAGDLVINAKWDAGADLDVSLVSPDGSRVSWMGGRNDVIVADSTASDREELGVRSLRKGNYLVEISRGDAARSTIRGTLDVTVLGVRKSLPFEMTGARAVVGRIGISLESHLEAIDGSGFRTPTPPPPPPRTSAVSIRFTSGSPEETRVVQSRMGIFRACYQRQLNVSPGSSGQLSFNLSVDDSGTPIAQIGNPGTMSSVASCVASNLRRLHFPAGTAHSFQLVLMFQPN